MAAGVLGKEQGDLVDQPVHLLLFQAAGSGDVVAGPGIQVVDESLPLSAVRLRHRVADQRLHGGLVLPVAQLLDADTDPVEGPLEVGAAATNPSSRSMPDGSRSMRSATEARW